jgi:hypothetical protein
VTSSESIERSKHNAFAALRRFSRAAAGRTPTAVVERCELCSARLTPVHRHMLEMATGKIVCACDGCTTTFLPVVGGRFKVIPRDPRALPDFQISDADWESLALPINLAFFYYDTPKKKMMALYPSPAGATESLLPLTAWESIVRHNPVLEMVEPDVEALLVHRAGEAREYFIAPIDKCFALVGLIRMHWRGFTGGEEVWREIGRFFEQLKINALP